MVTPQNQPRKFEVRETALRRRLIFFLENPTTQQIDGLAKALYLEKRDAYRLAIQREAGKWGAAAYGPLDPFVDAAVYQDASNMAQKITSTYLKDRAAALDAGQNMKAWASDRADWKARQILQYEYGKSDYKAVNDFYTRNAALLPKQSDGSVAVTFHVEPREAAVMDECQEWIDAGEVSLEEMLTQPFPAHPECPHFYASSTGEDATDVTSLDGNLSPDSSLLNTPEALDAAPESSTVGLSTTDLQAHDFLSSLSGADATTPSNTAIFRTSGQAAEEEGYLDSSDFLNALSSFQSNNNPGASSTQAINDTLAVIDLTTSPMPSLSEQIKQFLINMWMAGLVSATRGDQSNQSINHP